MSYQSLNQIDIADGVHSDAFGRLRVSEDTIQFQSFSEYGISSRDWAQTVTSNTTISHSATTKQITLSNGGTITGNSAILQSKKYARYTPGQSLLANATLTGASWVTAGTASQYDVSATAITGGEYLHGGVLGADNQRSGNIVGDILGLATSNNYAGSAPDTITLVARTTASTGTARGVINWKEYY